MSRDYDYDELYPGRFIKAALLKGKIVTLTIADLVREEMPDKKGKDGKAFKVVLSFKERDKQLVANKLNCTALMLMFGRNTKDWRGKRVSFYPEKGNWFGKRQEAIRVYGSPDIAADIDATAQLGQEVQEFHLKRVVFGKKVTAPVPPPAPEPEMVEEDMDPETGEVPFANGSEAGA